MAEKIKVGGLMAFKKHDKAPSFVKGSLVITIEDFKKFVNENQNYLRDYNGKKQLRIQVTEGNYGLEYSVDTYGLNPQPANNPYKVVEGKGTPLEDNPDDLQF